MTETNGASICNDQGLRRCLVSREIRFLTFLELECEFCIMKREAD